MFNKQYFAIILFIYLIKNDYFLVIEYYTNNYNGNNKNNSYINYIIIHFLTKSGNFLKG